MARPALTSMAAIASVVAASSCCLPILPFVAAAGLAGGSAFLWVLRPYLLGASILLVALGFYQAARAKRCNRRQGRAASVLLWLSAAVVALSFILPQAVVSLYGGYQTPPGQARLESLSPQNLAGIRGAFNSGQDQVRVLVFLSPT